MTVNPFDFVNSICFTKQNLLEEQYNEKDYNSFVINKALSYYPDTILYANHLNKFKGLDKKLQYFYYLNTIRRAKRYSKWAKKSSSDDVEMIKKYYNCNNTLAEHYANILSTKEKSSIKKEMQKGG